jgi:hypothetical protein
MKIFKLLGLSAVVMILSVFMVGCGTGKKIDFTIGYNYKNLGRGNDGFAACVFAEELKSIAKTYDEWLSLRNPDATTELDEKYNEQFFNDNALIIYAFTRNTGGGQTEITKVSKTGDKITVYATHKSGDLTVMTESLVIIEVKKADIVGINKLRVVSKNKS